MKRFVESFEEFNRLNPINKPDKDIIDNYDIIFEEVIAHLSHIKNDLTIIEIALVGSRVIGGYGPNSDIDILVEYDNNMSERELIEFLNSEPFYFEDYKIDYIPLQVGRYGPGIPCIEKWIKSHREYSGISVKRQRI